MLIVLIYDTTDLPTPRLDPAMFPRKQVQVAPVVEDSPPKQTPTKSQPEAYATKATSTKKATRQPSFGYDVDPWGSPDLHKGHNHAAANGVPPHLNGSVPQRTTSAFTTTSSTQDSTTGSAPTRPSSGGDTGWGGFTGSSTASFGPTNGDGFGSSASPAGGSGADNNDPTGLGHPLPVPRVGGGVEEIITITSLPEKEGMFMFQHRNYEVTSARRNSKVIRRYSDFVWLLDCLHKRYPFRQLPLLPPKRVAINGNYIAADNSFVEKRRRGLARFANALVRHPTLSQEQLVIMFLTVPTELAVWRKQATISVQEEFTGKPLPPGLEDSLPSNLEELFNSVRSGVRRSAEIYINLCNMMERLTKRNEGIAAEYARFGIALGGLTEASSDTYKLDTNDVPLLNEGLKATAKHLSSSRSLLEDEAKAWDEGVLEDLKKQRDCLVSVRDLFDRRDRYDRDNIPQLERRIKSNEDKLVVLKDRPEGAGKPGDIEKVEENILKVRYTPRRNNRSLWRSNRLTKLCD
jgi:sorting nexin-8